MMMKLLEELCKINGVTGDEEEVAQFIYNHLKPYADTVEMDKLGNVIAFKEGESHEKKVMVAAHMDEVGLIVKKITKEGFIKFETVGGIDDRVLLGKKVSIGGHNLCGVIGIKAIHLQTREERLKAVTGDKMYIDIGASSEEEAKTKVKLGDYISFENDFIHFGDGFVRSKALDDRAGCAILLEMAKREVQYDTYFVFTVQEEIGVRGATVAAHKIAPDEALIVETTTCADFTGCDEMEFVTKAKQGAVVSVMDRSTIYHKELVDRAIALAKEKKIPYQMKKSIAGGNDSGAVHRSRAGVKTIAISIPCRYLHSGASVIAKEDFESVKTLCTAMICR